MTTPAKKPYHKKRHPWKNQDLRALDKRVATPPPPPTVPHTCADPVCEAVFKDLGPAKGGVTKPCKDSCGHAWCDGYKRGFNAGRAP